MANLAEITTWMNSLFAGCNIPDAPGAVNGLQVENNGEVERVAAAVDACEFTIDEAVEIGAQLLLVHHGLFWWPIHPVTGSSYRKLKTMLDANLAVYSMHLPLDAHREIGNNALLASKMGLQLEEPFFFQNEMAIGCMGSVSLKRDEVIGRLERAVGGEVTVCPGGPENIERIGIVTGGAGNELRKAVAEGIDTFITGEAPHWAYTLAEELKVNLLLGGHYATETFGVKALAGRLESQFGLEWQFIDHPSGL